MLANISLGGGSVLEFLVVVVLICAVVYFIRRF